MLSVWLMASLPAAPGLEGEESKGKWCGGKINSISRVVEINAIVYFWDGFY